VEYERTPNCQLDKNTSHIKPW